ncbi:uncharacterized protein LOC101849032 [Aplysia californica]|uniref:Uncharacterized protein LOC101849032 n=1 Tax=Aplysia californica TaxID=6500 RepID=A0ABM0JED3_APLCA|nr:uncharacterized protein LOC101849032 [Aplysia californica]XP_035829758.1 uncharacterized protein LOC101849032 [Aplysia californica]XP_035829759.1 uncharacterized protein LOC101849032 [Aplysia californica]XP_035829760.1 uncharacterized protein LOC101849032 [Aplysia californica]XP_035829761.1 uncharacterized protein LOC101849032 [Aplysia californica]
MEADEVTVVVHGARSLQGRKPGRHKFSVIFGVGTKKYRTSVVKDINGNPDWNEESVVHVTNASDHVFFTVTEKEDVLGQIIIPVASLLTVKGVVKKSALKAHKKCPTPQGELIFQCYVSKQRPTMITPQIRSGSNAPNSGAQLTGFQRLRQNFSPTPSMLQKQQKKEEKEEKRKSSSLANFNKKLSKSIHDIFHLGRLSGTNDGDEEQEKPKRTRFPSMGTGLDSSGREAPVVSHIVPNMASVHGGTRLVLEGRNLGLGKSDIMELLLCGSDLLDTIEFESDSRIYVTTKPQSAGKGDLWIETVSGGQNVIKNVFTFVDRSAATTPVPEKKSYADTGSVSSRGKNSALAESLAETPIPEGKLASTEVSSPPPPVISVERSSSLNQDDRVRKSVTLSGSATLPRLHGSSHSEMENNESPQTEAQDSPGGTGRFRKNFQKHTRRASESIVAINKDAEGRKSAEKSELQTEILRLHKENQVLKQENADMKTYIDGLVARVMIHCPEALAAGDDLKPLPSTTK